MKKVILSLLILTVIAIISVGLNDYLKKDYQDEPIVEHELSGNNIENSGEIVKQDIFYNSYYLAEKILKEMSLEEKISQILLVRFPNSNAVEELEKYQFGGYILFGKDFKDKTEEEVKSEIDSLQKVAKIPILTAVDEEGGSVVRVSSNKNLAKEKFKSPSELYDLGGFELIKQDTIEKSKLLNNLGINLNLAPVVDVSTNPNDYMYNRTLKKDAELTAQYARVVIENSKNTGVSYTLKHFPGYGNNEDTHSKNAVDNREYIELLENDLKPFEAGIEAGAEAVLISHNVVSSIDEKNPASLSKSIYTLLRDELGFTGIIITDDLAMGAVSSISDVTVKAILAGNDLIITSDYAESINSIKKALEENRISETDLDSMVKRIIAWKCEKGLIKKDAYISN